MFVLADPHALFIPDAMEAWAAQHSLNPTLLAWVALALTLGCTKTQVARWSGVTRQRVHTYCRVIRLAPPEQWLGHVRDLLTFNPDPFRRGRVHDP